MQFYKTQEQGVGRTHVSHRWAGCIALGRSIGQMDLLSHRTNKRCTNLGVIRGPRECGFPFGFPLNLKVKKAPSGKSKTHTHTHALWGSLGGHHFNRDLCTPTVFGVLPIIWNLCQPIIWGQEYLKIHSRISSCLQGTLPLKPKGTHPPAFPHRGIRVFRQLVAAVAEALRQLEALGRVGCPVWEIASSSHAPSQMHHSRHGLEKLTPYLVRNLWYQSWVSIPMTTSDSLASHKLALKLNFPQPRSKT